MSTLKEDVNRLTGLVILGGLIAYVAVANWPGPKYDLSKAEPSAASPAGPAVPSQVTIVRLPSEVAAEKVCLDKARKRLRSSMLIAVGPIVTRPTGRSWATTTWLETADGRYGVDCDSGTGGFDLTPMRD